MIFDFLSAPPQSHKLNFPQRKICLSEPQQAPEYPFFIYIPQVNIRIIQKTSNKGLPVSDEVEDLTQVLVYQGLYYPVETNNSLLRLFIFYFTQQ